jgi:4-amino-4-deoxy-L-arabinose transferase-like glycosyltransferase
MMERSPLSEDALCTRCFWVWLVVRTAVWMGAVVAIQPNAPMDLVDCLAWGHVPAWGYPKIPPLTPWIAGAFARLSPGDVWGVYLAGYLCAASCLWAAWRVGREYLPPRGALLAALSLDGLIYLTGEAAEFSNNIALNAAWALTVVFFVRATRTRSTAWWLALGLSAGLGLLCKYTIVVLLVPLAGYLVVSRNGRQHLRTPGPYLAALAALALFTPHIVWLVRHEFVPFEYVASRAAPNGWAGHLKNPTMFLGVQFLKLLPVLAVLAPLLGRSAGEQTETADRAVLHWAVIGPIAVLLGLSLVTGCQLRDRWGSPLWTLGGVFLLTVAGSYTTFRIRWAAANWGLMSVGLLAFWAIRILAGPYVDLKVARAHYPGRQLAAEISRRWSARCAVPFPIVAGESWRAGNVCCYSPQRPVIYTSGEVGYLVFDPRHSFWTDDDDLNARGGVVLWGASQLGDALPDPIRARFPTAETQPPIILPYQTGASVAPDRVGLAFIWPRQRDSVR